VRSEKADTPPGREGIIARAEQLLERVEITQAAGRILTEADPTPQDREAENRADLLTGSRVALPSTLKEDPEEMIDLDQEEGKGAS
jgi:hypothetical protein